MQRIKSLDLARGFTVLFIPIVHSVMLYGNASVHESDFGNVLAFIAEWPGAQVFMLLMGVSFVLAKQKSFNYVLARSVVLILLGYLLNVLKFVIPFFLGGLPKIFLNDLNATSWNSLLLIGDILQFAGIAILILWIIQKAPDPTLTALLLAIFVAFATPTPWGHGDVHALELVIGQPPRIFFPLFPWLMYPLTGMVIGYSLKEFGSKVFVALLPIGGGLMLSSFCAKLTFSIQTDKSFYTMGPWSSLMHLGFVCVWISGFHFLSLMTQIKSRITLITRIVKVLFSGLEFLSRRITLIYLIQWPLICWLLPVIGYHSLNMTASIVIGIDIALAVILITLLIAYRKPKVIHPL
jgi:uncharacterized membrane protein